ncbi:MAG TPA: hypothetical protein PK018_11070, partial [Candidatus Competibacter sp.]|nr:hypothetical protein [Candidatus Competibacter sp.]
RNCPDDPERRIEAIQQSRLSLPGHAAMDPHPNPLPNRCRPALRWLVASSCLQELRARKNPLRVSQTLGGQFINGELNDNRKHPD